MKNGGVRPGAGRKSKAEELGLQELLDKAWPKTKRVKFFSELAKLAETPRTPQGMEAGKLLAAYTYGKPTEKHELTGANGRAIIFKVVRDAGISDTSEDATP